MNNRIENRKKIDLKDIGYSSFFEDRLKMGTDKKYIPARIISEHKEMYVLRSETSELSAKISGKMLFAALSRKDFPAVGDWVLITVLDDNKAVIHEILPRKTTLARKAVGNSSTQLIATNIDVAIIIQSPDRDYNLNRFERYIALAKQEGIKPIVVLNKSDLLSEIEIDLKISEIKERFIDIEFYETSIIKGKGIRDLINCIERGNTYCFLGSSGVGKSSIINMILGDDLIKTEEISSGANRGKHVTTHRELFILQNGGVLIDNPGMREIGIQDSQNGIQNVFSEILILSRKCKYSDCTHICEPGCAVLKAIESGNLEKNRYENYIKLMKENEYNTMSKLEKREKDKNFGKFIKTAKKQIKRYKY